MRIPLYERCLNKQREVAPKVVVPKVSIGEYVPIGSRTVYYRSDAFLYFYRWKYA
jgi:hypothetical protein